jgi:hypothetical protein
MDRLRPQGNQTFSPGDRVQFNYGGKLGDTGTGRRCLPQEAQNGRQRRSGQGGLGRRTRGHGGAAGARRGYASMCQYARFRMGASRSSR